MKVTIALTLFVLNSMILCGQNNTFVYWDNISSDHKNSIINNATTLCDAVKYYKGKFILSDNDLTFALLDSLSRLSGNPDKKAFYFYLFNRIVEKSDGALAETIGEYCIKCVTNNSEYVMNYFIKHQNIMESYAKYMAYELYEDKQYPYYGRKYKQVFDFMSNELNPKYSNITNIFFERIKYWMTQMD